MTTRTWPEVPGLLYGADYNPEQWPEEVWAEDARLMQEAGVNVVSLAIFSWALLEPREGTYDFAWLDRVVEVLHGAGIAVDMATATASPPPWLSKAHPESLPVTEDGTQLWWGSRQAYCPSSTAYREAATRLGGAIAERYGDHPAVRMWHVNNEYGCHVAQCFCDVSAAAFRRWLQARYGTLDALNDAWGTAFWSQRYSDWDEVIPPRSSPTWRNPGQQLDWWRFSSDELLALYEAEREAVRAHSDLPITTNFMASRFKPLDYFRWGREVDLVSNDHYVIGEDPAPEVELALSADLTRGLARQAPWLLMENSTSAVNWQPRNLAKTPGQLRRHALSHVARGADGIMFFQWRASRAGAEKYHSGMVPHAGTDTKTWREVAALGAELGSLADVVGSRVQSSVALLWDYEAWWAVELDSHPSEDITFLAAVRSTYEALWRRGITVDVVHPEEDLSAYDLVVAPSLYLITDAAAQALDGHVRGGGALVVGAFSGIVDERDHIRLGGYPGALRELLGVRVEEFFPFAAGQEQRLSGGGRGRTWSELLHLEGAQALETWEDGPLPGTPAVTRHEHGEGTSWYVATVLDDDTLGGVLQQALDRAGVTAPADVPAGVEVVRRGDRLFVLNHTGGPVTVHGTTVDGGDAAVLDVQPAEGG